MALDWQNLIRERCDWVAYNFPNDDLIHNLMGVQEELGELTHHHLKRMQNIRGTIDEHLRGGQDAVGDMTIYLLGVMHHLDVLPESFVAHTEDVDLLILDMGSTVAGIRRSPRVNISMLVAEMKKYCIKQCWDYERIVEGTWHQVKQRDWQKNRMDGNVAVDQPSV